MNTTTTTETVINADRPEQLRRLCVHNHTDVGAYQITIDRTLGGTQFHIRWSVGRYTQRPYRTVPDFAWSKPWKKTVTSEKAARAFAEEKLATLRAWIVAAQVKVAA